MRHMRLAGAGLIVAGAIAAAAVTAFASATTGCLLKNTRTGQTSTGGFPALQSGDTIAVKGTCSVDFNALPGATDNPPAPLTLHLRGVPGTDATLVQADTAPRPGADFPLLPSITTISRVTLVASAAYPGLIDGGSLDMSSTVIQGGPVLDYGTMIMRGASRVTGGTAGAGGGVWMNLDASLLMEGTSSITGNRAYLGGGILMNPGA